MLTVPEYSVEPAIAERKFEYSLVAPTPSFITLVGLDQNAQIKIETTDLNWTGVHTVTIQVFEEYSQITKTFSF